MVRLLKQLRNAGWLAVVGTPKNAQWRATEKLLTVDFRKRTPLPDLMTAALEADGVEFIPENGGGAGVRLRRT